MNNDERYAEAEPPAPAAYEPPQLWEYGSLRVDTAGALTGSPFDGALNLS